MKFISNSSNYFLKTLGKKTQIPQYPLQANNWLYLALYLASSMYQINIIYILNNDYQNQLWSCENYWFTHPISSFAPQGPADYVIRRF